VPRPLRSSNSSKCIPFSRFRRSQQGQHNVDKGEPLVPSQAFECFHVYAVAGRAGELGFLPSTALMRKPTRSQAEPHTASTEDPPSAMSPEVE